MDTKIIESAGLRVVHMRLGGKVEWVACSSVSREEAEEIVWVFGREEGGLDDRVKGLDEVLSDTRV